MSKPDFFARIAALNREATGLKLDQDLMRQIEEKLADARVAARNAAREPKTWFGGRADAAAAAEGRANRYLRAAEDLLAEARERMAAEAASLERNAARFGELEAKTQPIPPEAPMAAPMARRSLSSSELFALPDTVHFNGAVEIDVSLTSRDVSFTIGGGINGADKVKLGGFSPIVSVKEPSISRTHAHFTWNPDERTLTIADVGSEGHGSKNGTLVEGNKYTGKTTTVKMRDDREDILVQCGSKTIKISVGKKHLPLPEVAPPPPKPIVQAIGTPALVSKPPSMQTVAEGVGKSLNTQISSDYAVKTGISSERVFVEITPNGTSKAVMRFYFPKGYADYKGMISAVKNFVTTANGHGAKIRVDFFPQDQYFSLTSGANPDGLVVISSGRPGAQTAQLNPRGNGVSGQLSAADLERPEPPTIILTVPLYDKSSLTINAIDGAIRKARRATAPFDVL